MNGEFEKNLLASIDNLNRNVNELIWANVFHDAINGCSWLSKENFAINPGRWAVGYNYFYIVFRILNECRPKNILELGLGQSSRLIGQYVKTHEGCRHEIVEHDADFVNVSRENFEFSPASKFNVVNITKTEFKIGAENLKAVIYDERNFKSVVSGKKFDFISIDGPYGSLPLSRIDLLPYIPQCLNENFCIVIDDFDRAGEKNTAGLIRENLNDNQIAFCNKVYSGSKDLYLLASANLAWLCSM